MCQSDMQDVEYMNVALELARLSADEGEVPVGAVVVKDGCIIGKGRNHREAYGNALAHAELEAINEACTQLGGWQLVGCTLYVTLEPRPMCAGAIINSRIERVVQGAMNPKAGSCGSLVNLFEIAYNHHPVLVSGVCGDECADLLKTFFRTLRNR